MNPKDFKRAVALYKRYQCDTAEYRHITERNGMNTGELNRRIWHHLKCERDKACCQAK